METRSGEAALVGRAANDDLGGLDAERWGWTLSRHQGFPEEATLRHLIRKTPKMLPLSGVPLLLILAREVPLGSGYADLVGWRRNRPVITALHQQR